MPPENVTSPGIQTQHREPRLVFSPGEPGGKLTVNPAFAEFFTRLGLSTASGFLELPGEVVSGHPDRHVLRVELPGAANAFYLKRQHVVGWREKLRNRLAGFGWVSRCEREAILLQQLEAQQLPCPRWAAFGTHGGRAFLLVEEVPNSIELRRLLVDQALSLAERRALATIIGNAVAEVHAAGFSTPDLTAKHVLVNPETFAVTLLDWQSATRPRKVSRAACTDSLGALHASLAEPLAAPGDRLRLLSAYHAALGHGGTSHEPRFTTSILHAASRHAQRRSVREQLQPLADARAQRLVWLAGEAVCAVPVVAAFWPRPAIAPPFYGTSEEGETHIRFANRDAILVRGHCSAPFGRLRSWIRAAPWRSPGVTFGRVLFHLERYGVPAPKLLAFGQRLTSPVRAEWFALYEASVGEPLLVWWETASERERMVVRHALTRCLRTLHDAGCVVVDPNNAFAVSDTSVSIADPRAVRIVRRVTESARRRDLAKMFRLMEVE